MPVYIAMPRGINIGPHKPNGVNQVHALALKCR